MSSKCSVDQLAAYLAILHKLIRDPLFLKTT